MVTLTSALVDDVVVGDDVAVGRNEEARALRFGVAARATAELVTLAAPTVLVAVKARREIG